MFKKSKRAFMSMVFIVKFGNAKIQKNIENKKKTFVM